MDTETVLQIIAMLDTRIDTIKLNQPVPIIKDWHNGLVHGLDGFKDYLQEAIEAQVNYAENALGE
jgi:hypothetical protein